MHSPTLKFILKSLIVAGLILTPTLGETVTDKAPEGQPATTDIKPLDTTIPAHSGKKGHHKGAPEWKKSQEWKDLVEQHKKERKDLMQKQKGEKKALIQKLKAVKK